MNGYIKRKHQRQSWQLLVGGFLGLTLVIILGNILFRGLKSSQWNGQRQFGWVIQSEDLKVMVIIPNQKKLISLIIPKNTIVKVGFGFVEYRLNKVYELGKLENQA